MSVVTAWNIIAQRTVDISYDEMLSLISRGDSVFIVMLLLWSWTTFTCCLKLYRQAQDVLTVGFKYYYDPYVFADLVYVVFQ